MEYLIAFLIMAMLIWIKGSLLTSRKAEKERSPQNKQMMRIGLARVFSLMMVLDGKATRQKLFKVKHFLNNYLDEEDGLWTLRQIRRYLPTGGGNIQLHVANLSRFLTYEVRKQLLFHLFAMALCNNGISDIEWETLEELGQGLHLTPIDLQNLQRQFTRFRKQPSASPSTEENQDIYYQTLGLTPNATPTEVKKAYHQMAMKYHPDKAHAGEKEKYEKKFIKIKEAYEKIESKLA